MRTEGKLVQCDYPGCSAQVMLTKTGEYDMYEPLPEGWGYKDNKDLCPDHHQYYLDMVAEFWTPSVGKHAMTDIDELAEMLEADNSMVEPELKDEDILYTNVPAILRPVTVTGPTGIIEARVESEDW